MLRSAGCAAFLAVMSVTCYASSGASNDAPPFTVRLVVPARSVVDGHSLGVVAVLDNHGTRPLLVRACARDGWLSVWLSSRKYGNNAPPNVGIACKATVRLRPGDNRFSEKVPATYRSCSESRSAPSYRRCVLRDGRVHMPDLPPGNYELRTSVIGLPRGSVFPKPVTIAVKR